MYYETLKKQVLIDDLNVSMGKCLYQSPLTIKTFLFRNNEKKRRSSRNINPIEKYFFFKGDTSEKGYPSPEKH